MKPDKTPFKVLMPTDLLTKLKEIAVRESRSVTAQMNLMLRKQVETDETAQK